MKKAMLTILVLTTLLLVGCTGQNAVSKRCNLVPQAGSCDDIIAKYYFDGKQCLDFAWSGCDGVVPFETREECVTACEEPLPPVDHIVYTTDMSEDPEPYRTECESKGGEFNDCGSSCPPDAELCVQVCAYTCDIPLE